jgi:hypothetical protein
MEIFKLERMNPKDKAQEIFNSFYMILFDSESDKGEEILVSMLAKKCAIEAVTQIIQSEVMHVSFWFKVQKKLIKM